MFPAYLLHALGLDRANTRGFDPELIQHDSLVFDATITSASNITQPEEYAMPDKYFHYLFSRRAHIENPGLNVVNHVNTLYNIERKPRRDVFATDQVFSDLVDIMGTNKEAPLFFRMSPGERFNVRFSIREGDSWNGSAIVVGIMIDVLSVHESLLAELR